MTVGPHHHAYGPDRPGTAGGGPPCRAQSHGAVPLPHLTCTTRLLITPRNQDMKPPPPADYTATDATVPDEPATHRPIPPAPPNEPPHAERPSPCVGAGAFGADDAKPDQVGPSQRTAVFAPGPVNVRRAVADACGLLLIVVAGVVVYGVYAFADLCGVDQAPHEETVTLVSSTLAAVIVLVWLTGLLIKRGARRWVCLAAVVVGVLAVVARIPEPWQPAAQVPGTVGGVVFHTALGWLVVEVCRRHGITVARLGLVPQRLAAGPPRGGQWALLLTVAMVCWLTMDLIGLLSVSLAPFTWLPVPRGSLDAGAAYGSWDIFPAVFGAVILEDVLLVGAVAALLHTARRPTWVIYTVVSVIEVAFHLHYGLAAAAFVPYALLRTWLYLRYQRLLPLLLAHAAADVSVVLMAPVPLTVIKIACTWPLIWCWSEQRSVPPTNTGART